MNVSSCCYTFLLISGVVSALDFGHSNWGVVVSLFCFSNSRITYDDIKHLLMCSFAFRYLCIILLNLCGTVHVFFWLPCISFMTVLWKLPWRTISSQLLKSKFQLELIMFLSLFQEWIQKWGLASQRIEFSGRYDCFRDRHLILAAGDTGWNLHWHCQESNRFSFLLNFNVYKVRAYFGVLRLSF